MKLSHILKITAVVLLLSFLGQVAFSLIMLKVYFEGTTHHFTLAQEPEYLSEALAYDKAFKSLYLSRLGDRQRVWIAMKQEPTRTPWGTEDTLVSRNTGNLNRVVLMFQSDDDASIRRFVSVELHGNEVDCIVTRPK